MLTPAEWLQANQLCSVILSNCSKDYKTQFYLAVLDQMPAAWSTGINLAQQAAARQAFAGSWGTLVEQA